mgnify:CR=1 FL=1
MKIIFADVVGLGHVLVINVVRVVVIAQRGHIPKLISHLQQQILISHILILIIGDH